MRCNYGVVSVVSMFLLGSWCGRRQKCEMAGGPWQRGIAYKGFSPMVKDGGELRSQCNRVWSKSLLSWNSEPERHRHRLDLRKTRAFSFLNHNFANIIDVSRRLFFFLIFLKKDVIRRTGCHISHLSGKDPVNARLANPISHCDSQSWHSGIGRHWGQPFGFFLFHFASFVFFAIFCCQFLLVCVPSIWL